MIDFSKLPNKLPQNIAAQGNSGIVLCWMLAKLFDFEFNLKECLEITELNKKGLNAKNIEKYVFHKGLFYFDPPENTSISFNSYDKLLNNNIISGIIYTGYGKDLSSHISLLNNIEGANFVMAYGNPNYNDLNLVHGLYIFFISTLKDISSFVQFSI